MWKTENSASPTGATKPSKHPAGQTLRTWRRGLAMLRDARGALSPTDISLAFQLCRCAGGTCPEGPGAARVRSSFVTAAGSWRAGAESAEPLPVSLRTLTSRRTRLTVCPTLRVCLFHCGVDTAPAPPRHRGWFTPVFMWHVDAHTHAHACTTDPL